jgi:hypothetical protein
LCTCSPQLGVHDWDCPREKQVVKKNTQQIKAMKKLTYSSKYVPCTTYHVFILDKNNLKQPQNDKGQYIFDAYQGYLSELDAKYAIVNYIEESVNQPLHYPYFIIPQVKAKKRHE